MKFETSDIATAAFLLMKNFKLEDASIVSGKYEFVFDDPTGSAKLTCVEFLNSDCSKFDNHMRSLRSLMRVGKK